MLRTIRSLLAFILLVLSVSSSPLHAENPVIISAKDFTGSIYSTPAKIIITTSRTDGVLEHESELTLLDPDRFVIDLPGMTLKHSQTSPVESSVLIERVRTGQQTQGARIVIDLKRAVGSSRTLSPDKKSLTILFSPGASPDPAATPTAAPPIPEQNLKVSFSDGSLDPDKLLKFSVDRNFLSLEAEGRPLEDLTVVNKTDKPLFLRSSAELVINPGAPDEHYEVTKALLASPRRFELPPLASRPVRLVLVGKRSESEEAVYRVSLYPQEDEFADVPVQASVNNVLSTVNVVAGLGVIVSVPHEKAAGAIAFENPPNHLIVKNSGNRTVAVEECSQCPMETKVCTSLPRKLLYPNRSWDVPVSGMGVVTCFVHEGKSMNKLTMPFGRSENK